MQNDVMIFDSSLTWFQTSRHWNHLVS